MLKYFGNEKKLNVRDKIVVYVVVVVVVVCDVPVSP